MMKTVLLVIACTNFRDEELFDTQKELKNAGIKTVIASSSLNKCSGVMGGSAKPEILLKDVNIANYDAIAFIGGMGAKEYINDPTAHKLAQTAYKDGKVVAAICIAPAILAKAGLLKNKRFTSTESEIGNIKAMDGIHYPEPVVADGKIVTGSGPAAATNFGKKITELLLI
ncbi:MAG: DJ-1/PfpI family protein [Pseudomonadota bacterium]